MPEVSELKDPEPIEGNYVTSGSVPFEKSGWVYREKAWKEMKLFQAERMWELHLGSFFPLKEHHNQNKTKWKKKPTCGFHLWNIKWKCMFGKIPQNFLNYYLPIVSLTC